MKLKCNYIYRHKEASVGKQASYVCAELIVVKSQIGVELHTMQRKMKAKANINRFAVILKVYDVSITNRHVIRDTTTRH
jgi:hypothetical protein